MRDKDLINHLAGDTDAPLDPADRASVNELRALLADEAVWVEPDPALEDPSAVPLNAPSLSSHTAKQPGCRRAWSGSC